VRLRSVIVAGVLLVGCTRLPRAPVTGDPDPCVVYPLLQVSLRQGETRTPVSLPYVSKDAARSADFTFELTFPDSVAGRPAYLNLSVDDRAEAVVNGTPLGAVEDIGELYLGPCDVRVPFRIALHCSAYAEPARLRGLWIIVRAPKVHALSQVEEEFRRLLQLSSQRWEDWEWSPSPEPLAAWKPVTLPSTWHGREESRWFRTRFPWPASVNGFPTHDDSLWLRLAVNDSAVVYVDGQLLASFRRQGNVVLGRQWEGERQIVVEVIGRRNRGGLQGAWITSSLLASQRPLLDSLSQLVQQLSLLIKEHPDSPREWEATVSGALAEIQQVLAAEPRDHSALSAAINRSRARLRQLEPLLRRYPPHVCGPYLQNVQPHQITVMWETAVPCRGWVWYRAESEKRWKKVRERLPRTLHEVILQRLSPDTRFWYCVQSGEAISPIFSFRTAPAGRKPFRLAVWGDSRSDPRMHETVVRQMCRHRPDLAVHVGDVVGHGANRQEWPQMHLLPARWLMTQVPTYVAIGNHEYGGFGYGNRVPPFEEYFSHPGNEYYFSFDYSGCHFIVLDSNVPAEDGVPLGRKQFAWLRGDLDSEASRKADWRFVFLHHPPYSEAWDWGGYYDGEPLLRDKLVPLLEEHGVSFVFSGHTHDYERGCTSGERGPCFIITGGGGAELDNLRYRDWPEIELQEFAYHFCLLDVDSSRIRFQAIRHDGTILDEFVMNKSP